ncbi:MAG TPA: hypothetical protein VMV41_00530 [Cellulomonadaceae bacterium]|nr:hypothetical protein [Cellulomonadaceae bacterium]
MDTAPDHARRPGSRAALPWVLRPPDLEAHGITRADPLGGEVVAVAHGAWAPPGVLPAHPDARIAATALRLAPGCVVGGWAAARLHERAADPDDDLTVFTGDVWHERAAPGGWVGDPSTSARVLVCAPRAARLRPGDHARIFRSVVPPADRTVVDGIPVTTPVRTAFDLARLWWPPAAVAAMDRLLHLGAVDLAEVQAMALVRHRWRGRPSALQVLEKSDAGAASPQASALRLLWLDAGLPRPRCNPVIRDSRGTFVARVDLLDPDVGVVGAYDGAHHADAARRGSDARREQALEGLGLAVVRATAADVATEAASTAWQRRLRRAYRRRRTSRAETRWHMTDD